MVCVPSSHTFICTAFRRSNMFSADIKLIDEFGKCNSKYTENGTKQNNHFICRVF